MDPVARVVVDVPLAHLDRPFDYLVPAELADSVLPGTRVRVRFAGQLVDAVVLERAAASEHDGRLAYVERSVSAEPVLSAAVATLARAVADRWAGSLTDVLRLALPPRHARVEKEPPQPPAPPEPVDVAAAGGWAAYRAGEAFLRAVAGGRAPRAVWSALPGDDWPRRFAEAAAAALSAGRGALLVVPDRTDLDRLDAALAAVLGPGRHVALAADLGPAERYRRWLRVRRGGVAVVAGTRAAAFAPVADAGPGRDLGRRRRPARRAPGAVPARPRPAAAAGPPGEHRRAARRVRPHRRGAAAARHRLGPADRRGPGGGAGGGTAGGRRRRRRRAGPGRRRPDRAAADAGLADRPGGAGRRGAGAGPGAAARVPARAGLRPLPRPGPVRALRRPAGLDLGTRGAGLPLVRPPGRVLVLPGLRRPTGCARSSSAPGVRPRSWAGRSRACRCGPPAGRPCCTEVTGEPALVVATPGAEPRAAGGYGAALLLDGWALLSRPDLRAAEEALRRWANAAALVRPAGGGGRVVVGADAGLAAVQALVRWDPAGFAERELAERAELGFPPARRFASLTGAPAAVADLLAAARLPASAEPLGPVPAGEGTERLLLRVPRADGAALAAALHAAAAVRSARKAPDPVRIQLDPLELF